MERICKALESDLAMAAIALVAIASILCGIR
jgi:hypothetical protein